MTLDLIKSFVETANNRDCDFPLNNLPFGVCYEKNKQKCFSATAIGDQVLNLTIAEEIDLIPRVGFKDVLLNSFMSKGRGVRKEIRKVCVVKSYSKQFQSENRANRGYVWRRWCVREKGY